MLFSERNVDAVIGGGCLQFEVEPPTEAFAKREAPGFVDPPPKWCVKDQLHSPALVKEPLSDDRGLRRHSSENSATSNDIGDELLRSPFRNPAPLHQPRSR